MFCPNCGNQYDEGTAFCSKCGYNFNAGNNGNPSQANPNQMGSGQMNRNAATNEFVKLFKDAFENAKKFLSAPRKFIKEFLSNGNSNDKLPIPFMIVEGVLILLFSLICTSSLKGLVSYYVVQSTGGYSSYDGSIQKVINTLFGGVTLTIFLWTLVIAVLVWVCRFVISKVATTSANQKKVFTLLSIFASIQIIQWVLNIIFAMIFINCLKIDLKSFNTGSFSSNPLSQMQMYSSMLSVFNGISFANLVFTILSTLLYTFNVFALKRTTEELEATDGLPSKKALIVVIVFAVILIIVNNQSILFVLKKVCEKAIANATMGMSGFGF